MPLSPADLPVVGGDDGTWGEKLNAAILTADQDAVSAQATADAAQATANGINVPAQVASYVTANPPSADVIVETTARKVMTADERTKLAGVPADAQSAAQVAAAVAGLVDSAPTTLDTLHELATALGDDPNFATTMTTTLSAKVPTTRTVNGHTLDADVTVSAADVGLTAVDNTADVDKPLSDADKAVINLAVRYWPIIATSAAAWPTRASVVPSWFTGAVEWDGSLFAGVVDPPAGDVNNGDRLTKQW